MTLVVKISGNNNKYWWFTDSSRFILWKTKTNYNLNNYLYSKAILALIRNIYSVGLFIAGNYLAIEAIKNDEPNILIPLLYAGAIYNGIYATLEIYRCSDSLIKASQKISDIEKSLDIKIEN